MTDEQIVAAMQIVALLQKAGVGLDDEMTRFVRANLAQVREPEPVAPPSDGDLLDRGGVEPMNEGGSVQGGVTIGEQRQTIRERVVG